MKIFSRYIFKSEVLLGTAIALFIKVISALGSMLLNIYLARTLGSSESGIFFLALSLTTILTVISLQGFNSLVVKHTAESIVNNERSFISELYCFSVTRIAIFSLIISLVFFSFSEFIAINIFKNAYLSSTISILVLATLPIALNFLHGGFFQGCKKLFLAMSLQSAALPIITLLLLLFFDVKDARGAASLYLLSAMLISICGIIIWRKSSSNFITLIRPGKKIKHILRNEIPYFYQISLINMVILWSGQIFIGAFSETEDVAIYTVAQRTAMLTSFLLSAVSAITSSKFASSNIKQDSEELKETLVTSNRILLGVSFPIFIFILFNSKLVMSIFGPDFSEGANILIILSFGQLINVLTGGVGYYLQMTGQEKFYRNSIVYSALIMIVFCPIAMLFFGIVGAAIITAISIILQNLIGVIWVKRVRKINMLRLW